MSASTAVAAPRGHVAAIVGVVAIVVAVVLAALVVGGVGAGTVAGVAMLGGIAVVAIVGAIFSFVALARGTDGRGGESATLRRGRIGLCVGNVVALLALVPAAWGILVIIHGA